ncbi:MAG TPA: DUF1592 domain-containing protein [Polyangium sp.]|nr:DUF1592 domain-containing protein [Polyangium sp.]
MESDAELNMSYARFAPFVPIPHAQAPRHRVLLALLVLGGCTTVPAMKPAAHPSGALPSKAHPVAQDMAAKVVAVPAPLRRLTNEEYNNTIRDLLGDTSRPADAFPPDEAIGGFENNTIAPITQDLVERYLETAEALAARAITHIDTLAPCPTNSKPLDCARGFIDAFGRRAYRRPLLDAERDVLLGLFADKEKQAGYARAIEMVLEALLVSPHFLYRPEPADGSPKARPLTGYELATRLSYFLWASTPDDTLLDSAAAGKLATRQDVERAARRMLASPRAVDGLRSFHRQWLELRMLTTASKSPVLYPAFTPELKEAMVEETLRFTTHAVLQGGDTVATLLTSKKTFVNAPLAKLYGVPAPNGASADGFALVDLPPNQRSGLLTQAAVMAVLAGAEDTSPMLRGKFVREKLLCERIRPPPAGLTILPPPFDPKMTKKERFKQHRADPMCAYCHDTLDPPGFAFEQYDAIGAFRLVEGELPIDATGELTGTDDANGPITGAVGLAERLSASKQVRRCLTTQWFRAALGRVERAEDKSSLDAFYQAFARAGFDVRELIVAIVTSDAFRLGGFEHEAEQETEP